MNYRNPTAIRPSHDQIIAMALRTDIADVAEELGLSTFEVAKIVGIKRGQWVLRNNKTGEEQICWSARSAYRLAQLRGWTDYDFEKVPA